MQPSPVVTRNTSKGSKSNTPPPPLTLHDFKKLLAESEERVVAKFSAKIDTLLDKVSALESAINDIKAAQVQQEMDIVQIKDVILAQQRQIEAYDEHERRGNLVISNLPETNVLFDQETLTDDETKAVTLVNEILPRDKEFTSDDICEVVRLGRPGRNPRTLKVKLNDASCRNGILRCGRNLNSDVIRKAFGTVYINKDLSFLRRKEEKRLRLRRKELKETYPAADVRIKNGKLYLGPAIRDCVDYRNQLF